VERSAKVLITCVIGLPDLRARNADTAFFVRPIIAFAAAAVNL
jgi:hypothetical protein